MSVRPCATPSMLTEVTRVVSHTLASAGNAAE